MGSGDVSGELRREPDEDATRFLMYPCSVRMRLTCLGSADAASGSLRFFRGGAGDGDAVAEDVVGCRGLGLGATAPAFGGIGAGRFTVLTFTAGVRVATVTFVRDLEKKSRFEPPCEDFTVFVVDESIDGGGKQAMASHGSVTR